MPNACQREHPFFVDLRPVVNGKSFAVKALKEFCVAQLKQNNIRKCLAIAQN